MTDLLATTITRDLAGVATVAVRGELDLVTGDRLLSCLFKAVDEHTSVIVDLSGVTFLDCAGLRPLNDARRRAARMGRQLHLQGVPRTVTRVLRATGLESAFSIAPRPADTTPA
ncbi:STAS domain-containing protein [Streptomyces sp. 8N706]|uniref:STAS domain-containing protein n=1 Tax=Streptomyces sp. 8N706 TaxID=3457416 RepID=UPI003FCF06A7